MFKRVLIITAIAKLPFAFVSARPREQKKGADKGIDRRIYFHDESPGGKAHCGRRASPSRSPTVWPARLAWQVSIE